MPGVGIALDPRLAGADAEAGHGLFEELHGFADAAALADHLRGAADRCYGAPLRAFLEAITAERAQLPGRLVELRDRFVARHSPRGADGQVVRVAGRFGLVAAAGVFAAARDIVPWRGWGATAAAAACFRAWLAQRDGHGPAEEERAVAQVRRFVELHGMSRFAELNPLSGEPLDDRVSNRAGYRRRDAHGRWEYLVLPGVWREELCRGHDLRTVNRVLVERGLLDPDGEGKASQPVSIPGQGRMRLYHLRADILGEREDVADGWGTVQGGPDPVTRAA